jgi:hypothetical protein
MGERGEERLVQQFVAQRRLDHIATDLAELRKSDKSEYRRLAQKPRKALDDKV